MWDVRATESCLIPAFCWCYPACYRLRLNRCLLNYSIRSYEVCSVECVERTEGKVFTYSFVLLLLPLHSTKSQIAAWGGAGRNRKWMLNATVSMETLHGEELKRCNPGGSVSRYPVDPHSVLHLLSPSDALTLNIVHPLCHPHVLYWYSVMSSWFSNPDWATDPQMSQQGLECDRWGGGEGCREETGNGFMQTGSCLCPISLLIISTLAIYSFSFDSSLKTSRRHSTLI